MEELTIDLHDGSDDKASLIIIHKDRPEHLNLCLQSIAITCVNNAYEIIVVDNASGKDSQPLLDEIHDNFKLIRNSQNIFWGPASTKGVEIADSKSKYLVFLHSDVVFLTNGWLDNLINIAESIKAGIVGVEVHQYYLEGKKLDYVREWCMLITRECWQNIGPFPPSLPQFGTACYMTCKAQSKGYVPQVYKGKTAHHFNLFSLDVNEWERLIEKAHLEIPRLIKPLTVAASS